VQLDEAVARGDGGNRLVVLVIGVGDFELRLLRIAAERVARFQRLEQLDGAFVVAAVEIILGFGVEFCADQPAVSSWTSGNRPQPPRVSVAASSTLAKAD
jgi:hypothetical protein